ncbi:hypothetical protein [Lysinibacter cavernae]|uniref:MmcB family DNA repair protein n=1 Tax=Lysinibacter cavernae TaxID=1640652 RepID=A0A7X5QYX4_9MICO|nr:hypothetical protein [Lysinibacter cavernae]NIH52531.1 hypothetical protein [Lysinibacter cavernae]
MSDDIEPMTAAFILNAIRKNHRRAAIVSELSIDDFDLPDSEDITENHYSYKPRPEGHKLMRRIDALMWSSLERTAIEIKVTKADFMRDTYWKRRAWQRVSHRFIYAVPHDLDVMSPHGCGLWRIHKDGRIEVAKKAIINRTPDSLPQTVVQRMAYRISGERDE